MAKHILVIDDDTGVRTVVAEVLEEEGYEVMEAQHGEAALAVLARARPDAILLDIRMPVMDGWEFARKYKAGPGPHAPLMVMTAAQDHERWCAEVGADACLPKPFQLTELVEHVKQLVPRN